MPAAKNQATALLPHKRAPLSAASVRLSPQDTLQACLRAFHQEILKPIQYKKRPDPQRCHKNRYLPALQHHLVDRDQNDIRVNTHLHTRKPN